MRGFYLLFHADTEEVSHQVTGHGDETSMTPVEALAVLAVQDIETVQLTISCCKEDMVIAWIPLVHNFTVSGIVHKILQKKKNRRWKGINWKKLKKTW